MGDGSKPLVLRRQMHDHQMFCIWDQEEAFGLQFMYLRYIGWRTAFKCFVYQQHDLEFDPRGNKKPVELEELG